MNKHAIFKGLILIGFLSLMLSCKNKSADISQSSKTYNPESVGFSSERLARVDTFLADMVKRGMMPNAVTFVYRKGKVVHHKAFGFKNIEKKEPVELNSIFRIASQTKAITSVGLMMLYEKGLFLLDDPVSKYIPEFTSPQVLVKINPRDSSYTSRPAKSEITIRQLLSHSSGIPYPNEVHAKYQIPGVNSLEPVTIGEVTRKLAQLPLVHDPGERFTYGLNTDVLGYLIEILSGKRLDRYFKEDLFTPLEMNDSYFYLPAEKTSRLVTLYSNDSLQGKLYPSINIANQTYPYSGAKTYFSGGAGVVGTIHDYANFCEMLLHHGEFKGRQILGRKTIELMLRNQIGNAEVWNTKNKFGLGFELKTEDGLALAPGTLGSFSWGGLYATDYLVDPKEDMFMIIYTNAYPFSNPDINKRFRVLVYQSLIPEK